MNPFELFITSFYSRLGVLRSRPARLALAPGWTLLVTVLLVQSSSQPLVGPPAPPGPPDLRREIELTMGHIAAFLPLVTLWWWALLPFLPSPRAIFVAAGFALVFGVLTELAQTAVADRQASLYDLAINWSVTIFMASFLSVRGRSPSRYRVRLPSSKMPVGWQPSPATRANPSSSRK